MSIQLVTYANQTVTPTNDAIIYERAIDQNGIFYGCNVTVSGNEVHITGGYGIVCGREFTIESEAIAVTLAPSGTLDGRLYVRLDLADADAPIQLLTATGNTLPPLEKDDDVNYTNGAYEMELATFTVGVSALSDVAETFETIVGAKDGYMNIDTTASPGTTDGDLYAAITTLGWTSDVIDELLNDKKLLTKILNTVGKEVPNYLVTTNYGIRVYYRKTCGIRILHIEGNPSGSIGTSGHSFTITDARVDSDAFYRAISQDITASNFYTISLQNNTITIMPLASTTAYVNATFVY